MLQWCWNYHHLHHPSHHPSRPTPAAGPHPQHGDWSPQWHSQSQNSTLAAAADMQASVEQHPMSAATLGLAAAVAVSTAL